MGKKANTTLLKKWENHVLNASCICSKCGKKILYFCKYDADFCPYCNEWISKNCGDSNCSFCASRPETPESALELCNALLEDERASHNKEKEKAMRHYLANEKHRKRDERSSNLNM